jgi:hypothetical protein
LGLFSYELRGMLLCVELVDRGGKLEQAMQLTASGAEQELKGHFLNRTEHHKIRAACKLFKDNLSISVSTASFIVYGSAILGWVVVTAFGIAGFF